MNKEMIAEALGEADELIEKGHDIWAAADLAASRWELNDEEHSLVLRFLAKEREIKLDSKGHPVGGFKD